MALTPAEKQKAYRERLKQKAQGTLPTAPAPCNIPATKRWKALISQAQTEMQSYYDDRSEEWQESDRGQEFTEALEHIEALLNFMDHK